MNERPTSAPVTPYNIVISGDCVEVMRALSPESADLILTDPPYGTQYHPTDGRRLQNDDNHLWLEPAFTEMFRLLRPDSFCLSFYGWPLADRFLEAFKKAGFRPVSHLVFLKRYCSYAGYTKAHHEVAYLLAKGSPERPQHPLRDTFEWEYTGNRFHPTEKPVSVLARLVEAFSIPGMLVLDPFCGSGSSLVAAKMMGRRFLGIEVESLYADVARRRLTNIAPAGLQAARSA